MPVLLARRGVDRVAGAGLDDRAVAAADQGDAGDDVQGLAQGVGVPVGTGAGRDRVLERIERFDATYSRFRPDSLVSRIAAAPDGGRFAFPPDSLTLFGLYDRPLAATDGAVDPLVGRALELLGYDAMYSLTPAAEAVVAAERPAAWAADVVRDGPVIVTRRPLVIDVGAAGKGYLVDIVSALLREAGFTRFVVDASGDLRQTP